MTKFLFRMRNICLPMNGICDKHTCTLITYRKGHFILFLKESVASARLPRVLYVFWGLLSAAGAFAQSAPFAHTSPAHVTGPANATLNGFATPNGLPTVAWFEWGTNGSYGNVTSPVDVGSGNSVVWTDCGIDGLVGWEIYHFRLVASNSMGTTFGPERLLGTKGSATGWGTDTYGQATGLSAYSDLVAVEAGLDHTLALRRDGTVVAAGNNGSNKATVPNGA